MIWELVPRLGGLSKRHVWPTIKQGWGKNKALCMFLSSFCLTSCGLLRPLWRASSLSFLLFFHINIQVTTLGLPLIMERFSLFGTQTGAVKIPILPRDPSVFASQIFLWLENERASWFPMSPQCMYANGRASSGGDLCKFGRNYTQCDLACEAELIKIFILAIICACNGSRPPSLRAGASAVVLSVQDWMLLKEIWQS